MAVTKAETKIKKQILKDVRKIQLKNFVKIQSNKINKNENDKLLFSFL